VPYAALLRGRNLPDRIQRVLELNDDAIAIGVDRIAAGRLGTRKSAFVLASRTSPPDTTSGESRLIVPEPLPRIRGVDRAPANERTAAN
jgi:hypothetical protein